MVIIVGMGTVLVTKAKFQNGHSKISINYFIFTLKIGSFTTFVKSIHRIQF